MFYKTYLFCLQNISVCVNGTTSQLTQSYSKFASIENIFRRDFEGFLICNLAYESRQCVARSDFREVNGLRTWDAERF